jgi:hypothetical protein
LLVATYVRPNWYLHQAPWALHALSNWLKATRAANNMQGPYTYQVPATMGTVASTISSVPSMLTI